MANVHYFQRYSQKENVVTNNTLLLLSRWQAELPFVFDIFLADLLGDEAELVCGPRFSQQKKGKGSIPDGRITQQAFDLLIETKLGENFDSRQLRAHAEALDSPGEKVLLCLGPYMPPEEEQSRIRTKIRDEVEHGTGIVVTFTTFQKLVTAAREVTPDHRVDLKEILDDYDNFCAESRLLPQGEWRMRAVAVGRSFRENRKHELYYEPVHRSSRDHLWMGFYTDKQIRAVGRVRVVVTCEIAGGEVRGASVEPPLRSGRSEELALVVSEANRIVAAAKDAEQRGGDLTRGHRFFLLDGMRDTAFKKVSPGGMLGHRYFDLEKELEGVVDLANTVPLAVADVAQGLDGQEWK